MNPISLSYNRIFARKKIKKISLLTAIAGKILFQPKVGEKFFVTQAFSRLRPTLTGSVTTPPSIRLQNGPTGGPTTVDVVALVARPNPGEWQRHSVFGNGEIDSDNPLVLTSAIMAGTTTVYDIDMVIFLVRVSD